MVEVFTRRMSRWTAEQQREAVADLHVEAYRGAPGAPEPDRQEFLRRFEDDTRRPGFDLVVASERRMAGAGYGFLLDRADGWWRALAGEPPPQVAELIAVGQVFALAELMVLPHHRREGIATRLIDQLLLRSDATLVTTLVSPDATAAHGALRAWGWTRIEQPGADPGALQPWSRPLHDR